MAKIKRIAINVILEIENGLSKKAVESLSHVNLLALNKERKDLLSKNFGINLVKGSNDTVDDEFYRKERLADDLYFALNPNSPALSNRTTLFI